MVKAVAERSGSLTRIGADRLLSGAARPESRRGASYFIGFMFQRGATVLLVPTLVSRLTPADLSRFTLLQSFILIAPALLSLRVHTAIGRLIYDKSGSARNQLLWSGLTGGLSPVFVVGTIVAVLFALGPLRDPLALGDPVLVVAILAVLLSRIVTDFASLLFRAGGNARRFLIVAVIDGGAYLLFAVSLLARSQVSYRACLAAFAITSLVSLFGVALALRGALGLFSFSFEAYVESLKYAWPTAGHLLGLWLSNQAARWVGAGSLGLEEIAGFSTVMLGLSVVTVASRVVFEVQRPSVGRAFASGDEDSGEKILARAQKQALIVSSVLGLSGAIFFALISGWLGPSYGLPAIALAALVGYVTLDSASLRYTNLLLARKASLTLMLSSVGAGAVALLFAALFVQFLGIAGLCLASMVGAALQLAFVGAAARKDSLLSPKISKGVI